MSMTNKMNFFGVETKVNEVRRMAAKLEKQQPLAEPLQPEGPARQLDEERRRNWYLDIMRF